MDRFAAINMNSAARYDPPDMTRIIRQSGFWHPSPFSVPQVRAAADGKKEIVPVRFVPRSDTVSGLLARTSPVPWFLALFCGHSRHSKLTNTLLRSLAPHSSRTGASRRWASSRAGPWVRSCPRNLCADRPSQNRYRQAEILRPAQASPAPGTTSRLRRTTTRLRTP